MSKIKLVMVDVDNTLVNSAKDISSENISEIKRITAEGVKFGIASGRTVFNILRIIPQWKLQDEISYVIGSNGAEIYDVANDAFYTNHVLSEKTIKDIYRTYSSLGLDISICVYEDDVLVTNQVCARYRSRLAETGLHEKVVNYETYISRSYPKVIMIGEADEIDRVMDYVSENPAEDYRSFKSQPVITEFVDPRLSKSFGVGKIAELLELSEAEVMTIGDNDNDIEMVRDFTGVAMSNATENVKQVATYHTLSCEESGVAHILKKMV